MTTDRWLRGGDDDAAIVDGNHRYTYAMLREQCDAVAANFMAAGLQPQDRVVLVARDGVDACVVALACLRAGFVLVPANPGYGADELHHVIDDSDARLVVAATPMEQLRVPCMTLVDAVTNHGQASIMTPHADDMAMIIYTSGTTGRSKGCVHTHATLGAGVAALRSAWQMRPSDVLLHTLPLFHVHGLCVALLQALSSGATVQLMDGFSVGAVLAGAKAGATVWMAVPTMIVRIIDHLDGHPADRITLSSLRLVTCGSAALSATDLVRFEALTGQRILERYGMSETMITLSNSLVADQRMPGAVGQPIGDVRIRLVDDELWVSGNSLMTGYWRRPDADALTFVADDDGRWLRTGDVASVDDNGMVRIVGRRSLDVLKVGGYKLSTREIEDALASHSAIAEVAVVGLPDREWGQRVCAVIVVAAGAEVPTLDELRQHVRLHESKRPRQLRVVEALPRNAMGKVQKQLLISRFGDDDEPSTTR
jgi:acyl-CoA synthetase (AMP-forming)/AMP-acid ligase II